jgi:hypothetical protein
MIKQFMEFDNGRKEWAVCNNKGAVSFWYQIADRDGSKYGGVEYHYTEETKPEYLKYKNKNCRCLGEGCYHDGSSLQGEEIINNVLPFGDDFIYYTLLGNHESVFGGE